MTDDRASDSGDVSPDDAERLAERFKPAWEADVDDEWDAGAAAVAGSPAAEGSSTTGDQAHPVSAPPTVEMPVSAAPAHSADPSRDKPNARFRQTIVGFAPAPAGAAAGAPLTATGEAAGAALPETSASKDGAPGGVLSTPARPTSTSASSARQSVSRSDSPDPDMAGRGARSSDTLGALGHGGARLPGAASAVGSLGDGEAEVPRFRGGRKLPFVAAALLLAGGAAVVAVGHGNAPEPDRLATAPTVTAAPVLGDTPKPALADSPAIPTNNALATPLPPAVSANGSPLSMPPHASALTASSAAPHDTAAKSVGARAEPAGPARPPPNANPARAPAAPPVPSPPRAAPPAAPRRVTSSPAVTSKPTSGGIVRDVPF